MKKEVEVKIELTPEEFDNLAGDSASFHLERTFGYFKEDFSNIKDGIFPRIKYVEKPEKEIILTIKKKAKENSHNRFFEREEIEIKVKSTKDGLDVENLRAIIKSMGFNKEIIFEKKRKNVLKDDIIISFDKLPFGFFVELEGAPEKIEYYINKYNLSKKPRITKSYLGLWEDYKKTHHIAKKDCIFNKETRRARLLMGR